MQTTTFFNNKLTACIKCETHFIMGNHQEKVCGKCFTEVSCAQCADNYWSASSARIQLCDGCKEEAVLDICTECKKKHAFDKDVIGRICDDCHEKGLKEMRRLGNIWSLKKLIKKKGPKHMYCENCKDIHRCDLLASGASIKPSANMLKKGFIYDCKKIPFIKIIKK